MIRKTTNAARTLALSGSFLALGAAAAAAQTANQEPAAVLDEVIVTARQRTETIQDVPIAVTAFTEQLIEDAGIQRPQDFIALTPNVTFVQTTNVGETQVHIRGVIQPRDTEPPFAFLVDGVLIPNPNAFNQELIDIQQIEVVRGPLGSIYGRNAVGGAILINTQRPGPDLEGVIQASYEFEGEEAKIGGYVSGPLVQDAIFGRLTVGYTDRGGYFDNITRRAKEDPFEETVVRARAIWEVSAATEIDFNANYGKVSAYAFNFNNQFSGTPGFETGVDTGDTSVPFVGNLESFNEQERRGASARLTHELGSGVLAAFVAYNKLEESMGGEGAADLALFGICPGAGPCPAPGDFFTDPSLYEGYGPTDRDGAQYQERNQSDTSAEVRFTSDGDLPFRYIVGAYYIDFQRDVLLLTGDFGTGASVRRAPVLAVGQPGVAGTGGENRNSAWALFGQAAYDLTDKLEISAALRYDAEDRENTNIVPGGPAAPLGFVRTASFERLQPRVSLRYEASDQLTAYATYGEGFRSGGFNPLGSRAAVINIDGVVNTTVQDEFPAETSKSFEVGAKWSLFGGRLRGGAAAFSTVVENAHHFTFFPFSLSRVITIVGENEVRGVEFDFNARLTDDLSVFGGAGLIDSEITRNDELPASVGNSFPYTPEHSLLLGAQYDRPLSAGLDLVARVEWTQAGEMWFEPANTPGTARPVLDLVNARLGLQSEHWSATLFARNLLDESYNADTVVLNVPPASTFNFVTRGTPRTIGVEISARF